ncbi:hypothetical protein HanIR_Chr17g0896431 [Helianthus annuus]|nr:hypothetical protein HanIR_Chr17g0896431 [Helianthus annuus]
MHHRSPSPSPPVSNIRIESRKPSWLRQSDRNTYSPPYSTITSGTNSNTNGMAEDQLFWQQLRTS